mgnify:FL=1
MRKEVHATVRRNAKVIGIVVLTAMIIMSLRFGALDVEVTTQVFTFTLKAR